MNILVPVDGSTYSGRGIDMACNLVSSCGGGEITLLNVQPDPFDPAHFPGRRTPLPMISKDELMEAAMTILDGEAEKAEQAHPGTTFHKVVKFGYPAETIVDYADSCFDLTVIGSAGLTGIAKFLLGSVATKVVTHAKCSVLVVKI